MVLLIYKGKFNAEYAIWWRLKQQTNGNAITVNGQKPMLDNIADKEQIS